MAKPQRTGVGNTRVLELHRGLHHFNVQSTLGVKTVLIMTIAKQLALLLVKETIAEKKRNKQVPSYAFGLEILNKVRESLDALVAEGSLIHREASVTAMTLTSFQTHKTNKI